MDKQREIRGCKGIPTNKIPEEATPSIEQGISLALEGLYTKKSLYSQALLELRSVRNEGKKGGKQQEIEASLELAKNGYIGTDVIINTLQKIRSTLRMAPILFHPRKCRKEKRENEA
jgi:hypothetical protein